ncbi:DUF3732 domain-containing protein [uncultured Proteiniphilum sp.]|uniref:DUF3732 domain-containing protein n=1 Tax=uncultured Proteiniphilum sp. TaxID=497637 RepID=UPI000E94A7B1|nr:DUF3732 domain-containing protein [uncultured Proteiniphilum sp.]HBN04800.1 hypothetical protein [Bacteroidales bacterium]
MNFYIEEIKLWFKGSLEPKSYYLEPNKVNVITGTATKGKSSFISIIDYCLLASYSKIVETIINENISWYGIRFFLNETYHSIARKAPTSGIVSPEFYYKKESSFTNELPSPNIELIPLLKLLNNEWGITDELVTLNEQKNKSKTKISFRSFLPYSTITENIITVEEQFYDPAYFHDTITVKESLPFALGLNTMYIENSKRIEFLNSEIKKLERKKKSAKDRQEKYRKKLENVYIKASEKGLLESTIPDITKLSNEDIIEVLDNISNRFTMLADNSKIIREREAFQKERWRIKKEIENYKKCIEEYDTYIQNLQKTKDSLKPIEYLYENKEELIQSIETVRFIDALQTSLSKIKTVVNMPPKPDNDVYIKIKNLNIELTKIETEIKNRSHVKNDYSKFSDIFILVGKIKSDLEYAKKDLAEPFSDEGQLLQYASELERISKIPSMEESLVKLKYQLEKEIQHIYNQFTTMGRFNNYVVEFDPERYILKIKEPGTIFTEATIGSQSNYMFLHIAYFLGFHRFNLINNTNSLIPSFLFIDQPSKPYLFTDNSSRDDTDKYKLYEVFYIMNNFVKWTVENEKKTFQIFMLEHTHPTFWEGNSELDYFNTVATFFDNEGLIPNYVTGL